MAFHYPQIGPPEYGRATELLPAVKKALEASGVRPGMRVALYTDTQKHRDIVDAFFSAATILDAEVSIVLSTPRNDPDRRPLGIVQHALAQAELILDLASIAWIYTVPFSELLDKGIRILSNMSGVDTCLKMAPHPQYAERARRGGKAIHAADVIRVTSEGGTDFIVPKGSRAGHYRDGMLRDEGEIWDNFPACHCSCAPLEDQAAGTLVMRPGDVLLTLRHIVQDEIRCRIAGGRIVEITGGADARLLSRWFSGWQDPNSYIIAHIGFGCDPRADVMAMQLMEWEGLAGGVMIAFGRNTSRFLGGKNLARSHIDIVLQGANFMCDGVSIIERGEFVHPDFAAG
jgi:2,5-dihydroxypyridine 5,6-dioxygenase